MSPGERPSVPASVSAALEAQSPVITISRSRQFGLEIVRGTRCARRRTEGGRQTGQSGVGQVVHESSLPPDGALSPPLFFEDDPESESAEEPEESVEELPASGFDLGGPPFR